MAGPRVVGWVRCWAGSVQRGLGCRGGQVGVRCWGSVGPALADSPLFVSVRPSRTDEGILPAGRAPGILGGQQHLSVCPHALGHRHLPALERRREQPLHDPGAPQRECRSAADPAPPRLGPADGGGPHLPARLPHVDQETVSPVQLLGSRSQPLGCSPWKVGGPGQEGA